jgi:protoheme IX farnesyltransferase
LVAGGTNALNEYWERDIDALMRRTRGRPLPSGRLKPMEALAFATAISVTGIVWLAWAVNLPTAVVVGLSLVTYVFIYTPLKKRTPLSTLIGAVPGALPILAGWVAAGREVEPAAWALFGILFLWQLPHFLALAWIYRDDYRRGGLAMVSVFDPDGRRTAARALGYTVALLPVSVAPTFLGVTGPIYLSAAVVSGVAFVVYGSRMLSACSDRAARNLFRLSIVYLPVLLLFMALDKAG